jgi:predicted metal-dependent hydrolase
LKTAPYRIELGSVNKTEPETASIPIRFVRNRKARRYILRLLPGATARVTIPRGGTIAHAIEFARKNTAWLQRQLQRTQQDWKNGTEILLRGTSHKIEVTPTPRGFRVTFAQWQLEVGSEADARAQIEARLRETATEELPARTLHFASQLGLELRSVRVRDQRSRWGSCSARKSICLNWRLIQTPEFVRDYIIIHELMHLKEMNHSPRFWAHVQAACPAYMEAERWLRKNARLLR